MASDAVFLPVLPSFRDFQGKLASGTKGAGKAAGEQIAKELEAAVSKSERAVTRAGDAAEKAQNKVADATGKVRIAQEQYNKALESGDPVKIARAEEGLESARRRQSEATTDAERKSRDLTDAQERLTIAQDASKNAAEGQAGALGQSRLSAEEAEQASKDLEGAQRILEVGLVAVGAAAVATAGYLVSLGDDFHSMSRDIRVGTGASGDALADLEESALAVMRTVPNAMGDVGGTLADLNTRLGLTGPNLEHVSRQMLELENLTGVAPNINDLSGAMRGFGVESGDTGDVMDTLFQVSQATGVEVNELASSLGKGGATFREFGFDIGESAAMLGTLDKAGIRGDDVVQRLRQSLTDFAASGQEPQDALRGTVGEIENFIATGNDEGAYAIAENLFGTRGAAQFIDAVRTGAFELDDMMGALGATDDSIIELAQNNRTLGEIFAQLKNDALAELKPVADAVYDTFRTWGEWLEANLIPALRNTVEWVSENRELVSGLAIVLGSMVAGLALARGALMAYNAYMRIANVVTLLTTGGVRGLNAAMRANVIGLIVGAIAGLVAALVWFFTQTETGQRVWESLVDAFSTGWEWVKNAFSIAWEFIQPILQGLGDFFSWVGDIVGKVFSWVIDNWQLVVSLVFGPLGIVISQAITHWDTLRGAIQVVWDAIVAVISWAWNSIIMPVWDAMMATLQALGDFFQWVWTALIKPTWDALGAGIDWVWANIIRPAWDALTAALGAVGDFFSWVWNSVIKPAWDALGEGIRWVLDTVVHPAFEGLKTGLGYVETAFETAVDFIGQMWDRIKGITAAPIRFVIDTVYNNGIRAVWNRVADWLGLGELDEMPMPGGLGDYARGGVLPGYTPGTDVYRFVEPRTGMHIGLSGGEAIMRPEFTRAVGGAEGVERLNRLAMSGKGLGFDGDLGGYAGGGVVESITALVGQYFPGMSITSTYRNTADHHGSGLAVDFSNGTDTTPQMQAAARFFHDNYARGLLELIHWPLNGWQNIKNGAPLNYGEPTNSQHRNHVHVAAPSPLGPPGSPITPIDSGGGSGTSMIGSLVSSAFSAIMDPIVNALPDFGGGLWGDLPGALVDKLIDGARQFFGSKTPAGGGDMTPGSGPVVDQVKEAMAAYGWDEEPYWSAIDFIIGKESGWNPLATNPSSGAFGLPQFNPMGGNTLGQYLPDRNPNPRVQGDAMARYITNRYGNPLAARDFWVANNWYDDGGYLMPGTTLAVNETNRPEPVLTNPQWRMIADLVMATAELLDPLRLLARDGRDMARHLEEMAEHSRRQVAAGFDAAGLAVWEALPVEMQDAITAANAAGRMWHEISGRLADKALAWSKGEWPIGSARVPTVEPGPGWQQFHLDDSLENVARANLDLAEAVITGELSPGSDPVANAIYDIFGRDPILPDLARIASGGSNAIVAATEAAWHAFETGETARLEEWTASNSQLTEAVLRARDAAIVTGEMVQGAVNGYLNWAMASDSQGRMGSWQEYFQHYGGEYGTAEGDWLLSQVGLGGILGGKFKDSFADLLIATAQSPLLAAPPILDDQGRVIGTQLPSEQTVTPTAGTDDLTQDLATATQPAVEESDEAIEAAPDKAGPIEVSVTLPEGKSAFTAEEVTEMLGKIDEDVDGIKIEVRGLKNQTAAVTSGVSLMA